MSFRSLPFADFASLPMHAARRCARSAVPDPPTTSWYLCIYISVYIYRERDTYIYIYIYIYNTHTYNIYIYIYQVCEHQRHEHRVQREHVHVPEVHGPGNIHIYIYIYVHIIYIYIYITIYYNVLYHITCHPEPCYKDENARYDCETTDGAVDVRLLRAYPEM